VGLLSRRRIEGRPFSYSADVTNAAAVRAAAEDFIARAGVPDLVIANAGISAGTSGEALDDVEQLKRVLEVNVAGLAATLAAFAPAMRQAGRGTLAGIASVAGFRGLAGNGAYSASKSAAITWMESLRTEMHGSGVAVVCICPGYIDTPLTRVNRFRMPFLLTADEGARRIARAIERKPRLAVVPWQMALVAVALRVMPGWAYDRLAARAPRKPRGISP
jgi:NAD(P)-dependent dehydrogenase (short-subunit alcohol dehydrogenase family)